MDALAGASSAFQIDSNPTGRLPPPLVISPIQPVRLPAKELRLAKEDLIEFDGLITELLPEGRFRVRLENEHEILAYTAGRMKRNRIRSMVGDRVTVEMTPYDMDRGRITFRHRDGARPPGGQPFRRR